jgi:hypothetical protein
VTSLTVIPTSDNFESPLLRDKIDVHELKHHQRPKQLFFMKPMHDEIESFDSGNSSDDDDGGGK